MPRWFENDLKVFIFVQFYDDSSYEKRKTYKPRY